LSKQMARKVTDQEIDAMSNFYFKTKIAPLTINLNTVLQDILSFEYPEEVFPKYIQ
jgi:hypothetical protein